MSEKAETKSGRQSSRAGLADQERRVHSAQCDLVRNRFWEARGTPKTQRPSKLSSLRRVQIPQKRTHQFCLAHRQPRSRRLRTHFPHSKSGKLQSSQVASYDSMFKFPAANGTVHYHKHRPHRPEDAGQAAWYCSMYWFPDRKFMSSSVPSLTGPLQVGG